jgi:hypothetical protein
MWTEDAAASMLNSWTNHSPPLKSQFLKNMASMRHQATKLSFILARYQLIDGHIISFSPLTFTMYTWWAWNRRLVFKLSNSISDWARLVLRRAFSCCDTASHLSVTRNYGHRGLTLWYVTSSADKNEWRKVKINLQNELKVKVKKAVPLIH